MVLFFTTYIVGKIKNSSNVKYKFPEKIAWIVPALLLWVAFYILIIRLWLGWFFNGSYLIPYYMYFFIFLICDILINIVIGNSYENIQASKNILKSKMFWRLTGSLYNVYRFLYLQIFIFSFPYTLGSITIDSHFHCPKYERPYGVDFNAEENEPITIALWNNTYLESKLSLPDTRSDEMIEIYQPQYLFFKKRLATGNFGYHGNNTSFYEAIKLCPLLIKTDFTDKKVETAQNCDESVYLKWLPNDSVGLFSKDKANTDSKDFMILSFKNN
jgi:hypothetical protein